MLLDIQNYLKTREKASLHEMALHLKISQDTLLPMLELLIEKNKIERCEKAQLCGTKCALCSPNIVQWFRMVSKESLTNTYI